MSLATNHIKLVGYSGCGLKLEDQGGKLLVIKTSKDSSYNKRLEKQLQKQSSFKHPVFLTPQVHKSGLDDNGLYHFHMDYINGESLATHFNNIELSSIKNLTEKFWHIIPENYVFDENAPAIFYNKIEELYDKTKDIDSQITREALRVLKTYHWEHCVYGECHGDMTLENIIIRDGDLYLIDFLDSFYDSWMMDVAKLLQDLECSWSYRHLEEVDPNLAIRLSIFKDALLKKVISLPHGQEISRSIYHILLMHLVRIVPYTTDTKTMRHLEREMKKVINKLRK